MAKYKAYPEYKSSKVNYLGDIPKEWKLIKFGITNSSAELGGNYLASEGEQGIAVIKMGNLGRGVINLARIERIPLNEKYDTHHLLKAGDFLFNTRNSLELVGKVSVWREELEHAIYNSNILRITFDKKFVDSTDFISYLFNSDRALSQLRLIAKGTTSVAAIYYKDLSSLVFAFPPVREQAKIADFLDFETAQIDTLIEKQQTLIQLLKEKRQAVISHAVTKGLNPDAPMKDSGVEWLGEVPEHWEVLKLGNYAIPLNGDRGANYPSGNDFVDEGVLFISATQVIDGRVETSNASKITLKKYNQLGGLKIKKGDILYCLRGAGVGKSGICTFAEGSISSSLMGVRATSIDPYYLMLLLNSSVELQQRSVLVTGSVSPNLSAQNVMDYKFAIPKDSEQLEIISHVKNSLKKIDILLNKAEQAIQLMQERRTALISAAVTGKIDVRGWRAAGVETVL